MINSCYSRSQEYTMGMVTSNSAVFIENISSKVFQRLLRYGLVNMLTGDPVSALLQKTECDDVERNLTWGKGNVWVCS